jgi:BirA family biotin operon repressor/biotin-[acetyl-CoA-carboxylase] ligase
VAQQDQQQIAPGVYWVDQTPSTQDLAVTAQHELQHGDVIATDHQTAGRGRLDRTWQTPAGTAAAMSIVLRPQLAMERMGVLTLVVADALARWFRDLGVEAGVKWPNDIQGPDGNKLSGILAQWLPETQTVVVGVGTNLDFGAHARVGTAGALADYGVTMPADQFVIAARDHMVQAVDDFVAAPEVSALGSTMRTIGQQVKAIMPDGHDVYGTAVGLGATGSLVVRSDTDHEIFAADIVHLRPAR